MENPKISTPHVGALRDLVRRWLRQAQTDKMFSSQGSMAVENDMAAWVWEKAARELAQHLPSEEPKSTAGERGEEIAAATRGE